MPNLIRFSIIPVIMFLSLCIIAGCSSTGTSKYSMKHSASQIDVDVDEALNKLYIVSPAAKDMSMIAKGILVFPAIVKGGFVVGGAYGEGALRQGNKTVGYYNSVAASYGLQAGAQKFGYALVFMDEASMDYLTRSDGWEIGVGPSIVVVDEGVARALTSTTAREGVYAFFFDQKGLMAGLGIQGSKITQIYPK
jgi:lipid-binding SYLF domain-containing protein